MASCEYKYFSAQLIGTASTKFVDKQILGLKTMIMSIQNFQFQYTYELQAFLSPNTMYVQEKILCKVTRYIVQTTLDCTVAICTDSCTVISGVG